jgi:hypothetical protein
VYVCMYMCIYAYVDAFLTFSCYYGVERNCVHSSMCFLFIGWYCVGCCDMIKNINSLGWLSSKQYNH